MLNNKGQCQIQTTSRIRFAKPIEYKSESSLPSLLKVITRRKRWRASAICCTETARRFLSLGYFLLNLRTAYIRFRVHATVTVKCCKWNMVAQCRRQWATIALYVYVITWSTVDYTSVTSIIHCRHVVTILFHDCDKLSVSEENRCREDAINMFRVRPTVIELVILAATVVHCTPKLWSWAPAGRQGVGALARPLEML